LHNVILVQLATDPLPLFESIVFFDPPVFDLSGWDEHFNRAMLDIPWKTLY